MKKKELKFGMDYKHKGFTIIELMIGIVVFSIAMIIVLSGVIYISRQYQQSSTRVALEDASRNIHQQVSQSVRFSSKGNSDAVIADGVGAWVDYTARCLGKDMYVYGKGTIIDSNKTTYNSHKSGLWVKRNINNCSSTDVSTTDAFNLLPGNSRTLYFEFTSNRLQTLFVDAPDYTFLNFDTTDPYLTSCDKAQLGREFCSDVKLESVSYGRIN